MRLSLIITVLNEARSISKLLRSLLTQTTCLQEIVVIDGGSTDNTLKIIKSFQLIHKQLKLRLIEEPGNISHGRNVGVRKAKGNIIVMTDAGCIAKKDWLKNLTKPFEKNTNILVAGFYEMKAATLWQMAVAPFMGTPLNVLNKQTYLPATRSIAFSKNIWSKIGGFNEHLYRAGEDTLFVYNATKQGVRIVRRPDALVVWVVPSSVKQIASKFFYYALGDSQTGIWWHPVKRLKTHNIKILSVYFRYLIFLTLIIIGFTQFGDLYLFALAFLLYIGWSMWKLYKHIDNVKAIVLIPFVQVLSDFCVMAGFAVGLLNQQKLK